jgi:hypothetical protein
LYFSSSFCIKKRNNNLLIYLPRFNMNKDLALARLRSWYAYGFELFDAAEALQEHALDVIGQNRLFTGRLVAAAVVAQVRHGV